MATKHFTNRYAELHKTLGGAGDARPTALHITQDEELVGKLSDKVMLVTGGTNVSISPASGNMSIDYNVTGASVSRPSKVSLKPGVPP